MQRVITFLLILFCGATAAHSGAWPRQEGQTFVSAGGNFLLSDGAQLPVHYDPTLYVEYGLSERVTVGLDFHLADAGRVGTGFLFARFPLSDPKAQQKFAASLAFGLRTKDLVETEALMRAGLSWGVGLDDGWIAVDGAATLSQDDRKFRPKIDFTRGYRWSDTWEMSVQLQTGQGETDDYYAKVVPSVTYNLRDNIKLHLGAAKALTGDKGAGLKFETCVTF